MSKKNIIHVNFPVAKMAILFYHRQVAMLYLLQPLIFQPQPQFCFNKAVSTRNFGKCFRQLKKKLVLYTALFITVVFNSSRLMALRPNAIIARYWHFNGYELLCQALLNFMVCMAAAYIGLRFVQYTQKMYTFFTLVVMANFVLLAVALFAGLLVQVKLFNDDTPATVFRGAYTLRLLASQVLMGILVKIILLIRESKMKDKENEQLRNAYLKAQLELLKEELNPHFFFNTLSSLSAVVREDPAKAQQYISHLSKMFRYTLNRQEKNMVALREELAMIESYVALQEMRLEDGLVVNITIPKNCYECTLPFMSLQPLLENALKHNIANVGNPLKVDIFVEMSMLVVQNNLQPQRFAVDGSGTGLANLSERYRILAHKEIVIEKTADSFSVKLPLQPV